MVSGDQWWQIRLGVVGGEYDSGQWYCVVANEAGGR